MKDDDRIKFDVPDLERPPEDPLRQAKERATWRGANSIKDVARFVLGKRGNPRHGEKGAVGRKRKRSLKRRARNKLAKRSRKINAKRGAMGSSRKTWKKGK